MVDHDGTALLKGQVRKMTAMRVRFAYETSDVWTDRAQFVSLVY
jgi:hypothetical protein